MSKAEERAQAAYPAWRNGLYDEFNSSSAYCGFIKGYHQAEKDLELSWEDLKLLQDISHELFSEVAYGSVDFYQIYPTEQSFLEEVLKRFLKERKEK